MSGSKKKNRSNGSTVQKCGLAIFGLLVILSVLDVSEAAKQRHGRSGRHRRVPDPASPESGFARSDSQKDNEHKPKIKNCKDAQPEVEEGSKKGKLDTSLHLLHFVLQFAKHSSSKYFLFPPPFDALIILQKRKEW